MDSPVVSTPIQASTQPPGIMVRARRMPKTMLVGGVILIVYLIVAVVGYFWTPYPYQKIATGRPFETPSAEHFFGTDQLGRDVFSRVVYATHIDLYLALTSTLAATIAGGLIGLLSGLVGGGFDQGVMRIIDIVISIPFLVLALLITPLKLGLFLS